MTAGDGRMQGHVLSVRGVEKGEGRRANCKFRVASMTGPRLESNASPRAKSNASPRAKSRGGPRAKSRGVTLSTTSRDLHPAVKCGVLKLMGEGIRRGMRRRSISNKSKKPSTTNAKGALWPREDCDRKKGDVSFKIATRSSASLPGL